MDITESELCELANILIENSKFEFLGAVLKDLKSVQKIGLRALEPLEKYDDLITYLAKLNDSLDTIQVFDLSFNLEYLSKLLEPGSTKYNEKLRYISVSVKQKKPTKLCYGDRCLTEVKSHKIDELYYLSICSSHYFCRDCIKHHITSSLYKHGINEIYCEACKKLGKKENRISINDINKYLTKAEIENYFKHKKESQYRFKCVMPKCDYKGKLLRKAFIKDFECCGQVCKLCYAKSTYDYIQSYKDIEFNKDFGIIVGIMCPNSHQRSAEDYSPKIVREILFPLRKLINIDEVIESYRRLRPYFKVKIEDICSNCNYPNLIALVSSTCRRCKKCVKCSNFYHNLDECYKILAFKDETPKEENIVFDKLTPDKVDFQCYTECIKILRKIKSIDLKIKRFTKINLNESQEFYKRQLLKYFKPKRKLIRSDPIDNLANARKLAYSKPTAVNNTFYELFKREIENIRDSDVYFIIFQCFYEIKLKEDKQISNDDKYKLVYHKDSMQFNNKYMMLPAFIIQVGLKQKIKVQ